MKIEEEHIQLLAAMAELMEREEDFGFVPEFNAKRPFGNSTRAIVAADADLTLDSRISHVQRWKKTAVAGLGALALAGVAGFAGWPRLLEGYARDRVVSALGSRFDEVEVGDFQLDHGSAVVRDLTASRPGAAVRLESVVIEFDPLWLERRVVVRSVTAEGGRVEGTVEGLRALRGGAGTGGEGGAGRVDLSSASLEVVDFDLDVVRGGWRGTATAVVEADTPAGPFSVEMADASAFRGERALASAKSVRTTLSREDPFPLEVTVAGLSSSYLEDVKIQDVAGTVRVLDGRGDGVALDLSGETGRGQTWRLEGDVSRPDRTASGRLTAADLRPGQLPLAGLPVDPDLGAVSLDVEVSREEDLVSVRGSADVREVHVRHPNLARDPVVVGATMRVDARLDLSTRELVVESLTVRPRAGDPSRPSDVEVTATGRVLHDADPSRREYEIALRMGPQDCQDVLDAMPSGLVPGLEGFQLGGRTTLDLRAAVEMDDPDATVLEGGLDMRRCRIEEVPEAVEMLDGPFRHVIRMKSGEIAQVPLVRGSPLFVPLDEISPTVPAAVLSTEDGAFWRHRGYRSRAFLDSLRRNVELGTIRRGASTLTMQAVKNVLLSHERTLSRKLQELFLTWVVEKRLSKSRILEIYLNIVEFGPGIYGVAHASDHYFGKPPRDLNSMEAAFLASLLPRPLERHDMWCRGEVTERHDRYLRRVSARMLSKGRITRAQHERGLEEGVVFSRKGWPGERACLSRSRREEEGAHVQGAVTGLLGRATVADPSR